MNILRIICFCFLLLPSMTALANTSTMISVIGEEINMRSGPGTKYETDWLLGSGYPLQVLKRDGEWYRVQDFEGTIGWIHKTVVSKTPTSIVKANKNSQKTINIRSGAGTKYRIVGKAYYGVVFKKLEEKNGWVKVEHERGLTGWVQGQLLWGF